jgi:hypothetical protein
VPEKERREDWSIKQLSIRLGAARHADASEDAEEAQAPEAPAGGKNISRQQAVTPRVGGGLRKRVRPRWS